MSICCGGTFSKDRIGQIKTATAVMTTAAVRNPSATATATFSFSFFSSPLP